LNGRWVPHDVRDAVVDFVRTWSEKTELPIERFLVLPPPRIRRNLDL
jgi:hypothetical protein